MQDERLDLASAEQAEAAAAFAVTDFVKEVEAEIYAILTSEMMKIG